MPLLSSEIARLEKNRLAILQSAGIIAKYQRPKFNLCICGNYTESNCDNLLPQSFFCHNCGSYNYSGKRNYVWYTDLCLLKVFLQSQLNLPISKPKNINGLIFLGFRDKTKFYLLPSKRLRNYSKLIAEIAKSDSKCYIFCLKKKSGLNLPSKIKLLNLVDQLAVLDNKLAIILHKDCNKSFAGRLGGIIGSQKRFGEARKFISKLFKQKKSLIGKKKET